MKNLVKIWLRRNKNGSYVYYLRWIGKDGHERLYSLKKIIRQFQNLPPLKSQLVINYGLGTPAIQLAGSLP